MFGLTRQHAIWLLPLAVIITGIWALTLPVAEKQTPHIAGGQIEPPIEPQEEPLPQEIKIIITGDANLSLEVGERIKKGQNPFRNVEELFAEYDIRVVNLETSMATPGVGAPLNKPFTFNAPVQSVKAMQEVGVDLVSLANNHAMDYGPQALINALGHLQKGKISAVGAGKNISAAFAPKYFKVSDTEIAFLAFNDIENYIYPTATTAGMAFFDAGLVRQAISKAQKKADIVIVYPHWGLEHRLVHNSRQEHWAKLFIDAGADLVVGAHPHVRQGTQFYKNKRIYYSLGNFIFAGMTWSPEAVKGNLLEVVIKDKKIRKTRLIGLTINQLGFPKLNK